MSRDLLVQNGLLLVFSVTPSKVDQNYKSKPFDRWRPESGKWKEVNIQTSSQDLGRRSNSYTRYPRKCFTQIYRALYGDALLELIRMSSKRGGRKPTETFVSEFFYKSVNLRLEELINIKVILFLTLELFRQQNSSKKVTFFNLNDSSFGRHVNAASRKSLKIQAYSVTKPRTLLRRKFVWKLVFSCSNTPWK